MKNVSKWHPFWSPKKGFFLIFSSLCSGASRGARGPHPATPKAPQRRFMGAIVGALGRQSDAPNARKMTQRRPLDLISGKNELQWSFKTHSEIFVLFCKFFRGKRWPLESISAPYGPNMCWACPGHLFSQYFPTPFPDVILNVFFMLRSTVLLQICTWKSIFFRHLVSPVVRLIFGIVLMTCSCSSLSADHTVRGGFPRGSPLYCGVKPPPPDCHRPEFSPGTLFHRIFQHPFQTSFLLFFSCFFYCFYVAFDLKFDTFPNPFLTIRLVHFWHLADGFFMYFELCDIVKTIVFLE